MYMGVDAKLHAFKIKHDFMMKVVIGQLPSLGALYTGEDFPISIRQAGWAPEPVWAF
jgi:hypothetical protein